jgi:hypothetical protein
MSMQPSSAARRRQERAKRNYETAKAAEHRIYNQSQAMYERFARENQDLDFCRSIVEQVESGRPISPKQAAALLSLAAKTGRKIKPAKSTTRNKV